MRLAAIIASAALVLAACSSKKGDAAGVGEPAGSVLSVAGEVSATRGGEARALTEGAAIYRDDRVVTGADAEVTIELAHNGARLSLAANAATRIDESVAWRAPRAISGSILELDPEDHLEVAGREGVREAADDPAAAIANDETTESAIEKDGRVSETGSTIKNGDPPEDAKGEPESDPKNDAPKDAKPKDSQPRQTIAGGEGGGDDGDDGGEGPGERGEDEGQKGVDGDSFGAGKRPLELRGDKKSTKSRFGLAITSVSNKEARAPINRVVRRLSASLRRCVEPTRAVSVRVVLTVGAEGTTVELASRLPAAQATCISRALRGLESAKHAGTVVRLTLRWKP